MAGNPRNYLVEVRVRVRVKIRVRVRVMVRIRVRVRVRIKRGKSKKNSAGGKNCLICSFKFKHFVHILNNYAFRCGVHNMRNFFQTSMFDSISSTFLRLRLRLGLGFWLGVGLGIEIFCRI